MRTNDPKPSLLVGLNVNPVMVMVECNCNNNNNNLVSLKNLTTC